MVGVIDDSGRFPGSDSIRRALNQSVGIRHTRLRGEIIHLVVHQKSQSIRRNPRSKPIIDRGRHGDRIAHRIHHRIVRGVRRLVVRQWLADAPPHTAPIR